ncbi:transporter substrate-binding domain-containing protein [Pseudoalteromonas sp. SMS1]|uniref:substrate-binding periplasmic protein n=1 Tax=Pseudoalteromonas sp. SMS1 TaxID=2908894 RepID=UPI001F2932F8|nr:transporter substrate-binding domain-containing protein [Pseudoalteromonas sp. SMS1]MCF2855846.1 transporter substrate-binding domain-containing protein [Pseudoalteromonas sp. SMS1]
MKFLLLIIFLIPFYTHSNERCSSEKKIGIGSSWPPYVMYKGDTPYGLDIEITKLIFNKANVCFKFIRLPTSARGLAELYKGFVDVLPSASFNIDRANNAHFSNPYRRERMRLFTRLELPPVKSLTELFADEYTFVTNPGAYYGEELRQILQISWYQQRLVEVASVSRRIELVNKKRIDFLIEDEHTGFFYINQLGYKRLRLHSYIVNDNAIHFMLSRMTFKASEIDAINNAIEQSQPEIEAILSRRAGLAAK